MFIDPPGSMKVFAPAELNAWFAVIHLRVHCAPLERPVMVAEVYEHLASLEPEHRLVPSRLVEVLRSNMTANETEKR